ncbi:Exosome complex component RRP43 [Hypsizygus marmoreus]|uniref:Ribosomal RNA-processing protein 43 n=1 Tax=Hypsizygus marmoreus TaxID=39966 RepID=A0A369JHE5_HYPMA|nr:Exosome complex component RRP43 [Hypsizygus marmoreus]
MTTTTTTNPASSSSLSKPEQDALKASIFQRLHPRVYLERFLAENVRPDGRSLGCNADSAWRDVSVNVGSISTADGSALVRLGGTTVVCGVKAEIAEPELDHAGDGFLVPNLDLPAMCSPRFKPGPPSEDAQVLSDRLNEALVVSNILPLTSLCIHPGKAAWVLYVDATCINYDGNVFDAALLAMVAALKNTTLPKATFDEETGRTTCSSSRKFRTPLGITRTPIAMSFGVFDSKHILPDPTSFEEPLLDTTVSILVDSSSGALISVSQLGLLDGDGDGDALLRTCIASAGRRRDVVAKYI